MPQRSDPQDVDVCECEVDVRSACADERPYKHDGKWYCVLHSPCEDKHDDFDSALQRKREAEDFNFRGVWFPTDVDFSEDNFKGRAAFYKAYFNGKANFSRANFSEKADFRKVEFSDKADFRRVEFSEGADFRESTFNAVADFRGAKFKKRAGFDRVASKYFQRYEPEPYEPEPFRETSFLAEAFFHLAIFEDKASFYKAIFNRDAEFGDAIFKSANKGTDFGNTTFRAKAGFSHVTFNASVSFRFAKFVAEAYFRNTTFTTKADFSYARFGDHIMFHPQNLTRLDLRHAVIERPEYFSFGEVTLHPHWLLNVDVDKVNVTNVVLWKGIHSEIQEARDSESPEQRCRQLATVYRQLAVNAEENHRYAEASQFRYLSMNLKRVQPLRRLRGKWGRVAKMSEAAETIQDDRIEDDRVKLWKAWTTFGMNCLHFAYWLTSGYGERIGRATFWLIGIWLISAVLYTQDKVGFYPPAATATESVALTEGANEAGESMKFRRALSYSIGVISLQKPEPRPRTNYAHTLATLETIFGPVQAALLALAIRRKFMR